MQGTLGISPSHSKLLLDLNDDNDGEGRDGDGGDGDGDDHE